MSLEKTIKHIIILAGTVGALFLFPFLLRLFAPFIAAFFVAAISQGIVRFLDQKWGVSRGISSTILVTLIVVVVLGFLIAAAIQILNQAKNLVVALPSAIESMKLRFDLIVERYNLFKLKLAPEISLLVDNAVAEAVNYTSNLSEKVGAVALSSARNIASRLPDILIFVAMFLLGTFFFTKDYQFVINFSREFFPEKVLKTAVSTKKIIMRAFSSYMKAQLILMLLTSVIVTVSLWIIGHDYALLWGIVCGLTDALPILGTAVVLIPLAISSLVFGDIYSFVAIIIIQALVFVVRQLAEPKVISHQIGIHPILTLVSVYVGIKLFGIVGAIFAPIITMLLVNLYVTYREQRE